MYIPHFVYPLIQSVDIWVISTFLAIVNNVAMNMDIKISVQALSILLGLCLEVRLLDDMINLHLLYLGTAILFSTVAASFCTLISNAWEF